MKSRLPQTGRPVTREIHSGFTLVELLAVIAIIGVLSAIIIPVVSSARARAKSASCMSNLRQIGVAMNLYAASNKGNLPISYQNEGGAWWKNVWQWRLQPYVEDRKASVHSQGLSAVFEGVFNCPSKPNFSIDGPTDVELTSYGMNAFSNASTSLSKATAPKLNTLNRPGITMLVIDTNAGTSSISNGDVVKSNKYGARWHADKDNVLFVDGHVESLGKGELNYYLVKASDNEVRP